MRITSVPFNVVLAGGLLFTTLAGCTVQSTEAPALMGPSTLATSITLRAEPDSILFDPSVGTTITIETRNENGQPVALDMRAEIRVAGVTQDYGRLSAKLVQTSSTTGISRLTYFPPPPPSASPVTSQVVTIAVTPVGSDARAGVSRTVDIQLLVPGVIAPNNPTLKAKIQFSPEKPTAFTAVTFDASTSTNRDKPCENDCSYSWNFGDGTTGVGIRTVHEYRTAGTKTVTLTLTDAVGAQATAIATVPVDPAAEPDAKFTVSPTTATVNQDVFLNASESRPATGRTITRYDWDFGDGRQGTGVTVSHQYGAAGTYSVTLKVTDDVGATKQASSTVTIGLGLPTVDFTVLPSSPKRGEPAVFNASASKAVDGATIVSYSFNWGDGSPIETSAVGVQSHTYNGSPLAPSTVVVTVTVTDSLGRSASKSQSVTITP